MNEHKTILAILAYTAAFSFQEDKVSLSKEEVEKIQGAYKEKFNKELTLAGLDFDDDGYAEFHRKELDSIEAEFVKAEKALAENPEEKEDEKDKKGEKPKGPEKTPELTALEKKLAEQEKLIKNLTESVDKLADESEDVVIQLGKSDDMKPAIVNSWDGMDASRPWNLRADAMLNGTPMPAAASSTDYSKIVDDLGDYYQKRHKDDIQSFLVEIDELRKIFPMRSNIQDEEVIVNMFLGEFSQAFQHDFTSKGSYDFEAEKIKMYDVKFDHVFKEMKAMEKTWLGYLNDNGSNAIKYPFVRFLLEETLKKLKNEQSDRGVNGVYKKPETGVPGSYLNAANGLRKHIKVRIGENKIKPLPIGEITPENVEPKIEEAVSYIPEHRKKQGQLTCYTSETIIKWYLKYQKTHYGQDVDYKRGERKLLFDNVVLEAIPNMGASQRLIFTFDGNIVLCEDKPGEMGELHSEQEDRKLKVWSDWRESIHIIMCGKQWDNLEDADFAHQMIWVSDVDLPSTHFISMEEDDTTPSVLEHKSLVSVANTEATAITDIDDMEIGDTVILKCGSDTNAPTIAKAGNFSGITAPWTPDKGDTITLFKRGANDIIELARTTTASDAIAFSADDTTPSVDGGNKFVTVANTGATSITNLDDAVVGEDYTIIGGSDDNSSVIAADAANFDLVSEMTFSVGSYIVLHCRGENDFVEKSRG